ncbi:hypothetical protein JXJ21_05445 [candidate division KSB1 bacterium]|nr:hypothetical protein [candidate division KSB1 bacterium]
MASTHRIIIATVIGLICGLICWQIANSMGEPKGCAEAVTIILSRTLLGFGIGISAWRMAWWLHGIVLGFIFSIPMAVSVLAEPKMLYIFIGTLVFGAIYGLIVELITSVIFKAKQA